jgi:TRAP-type mannitol/chloroaromatic compound transport system permease large subunit
MDSTAKLSAFVLFILLGARVFSLTFYGVDGINGSSICWSRCRAARSAS